VWTALPRAAIADKYAEVFAAPSSLLDDFKNTYVDSGIRIPRFLLPKWWSHRKMHARP
jgi:hypothetical protein